MFFDKFESLCKQKGVSKQKACMDCGVSRTAWNKWKNGAIPNGSTINRLSEYFNVSASELLGGETESTQENKHKNETEDTLIAFYGKNKEDLTEDDIDDIIVAMRAKVERNKKRKFGEQTK